MAQGKLLWIAFAKMVKGGYAQIIEEAAAAGFAGLLMRAGQGGWNDPALTVDAINRCKAAGLRCDAWVFADPWNVSSTAVCARRLQDAGVDRFCIDAEVSWELDGDHRDAAKKLDAQLEAQGVTIPVDDAPWPWMLSHVLLRRDPKTNTVVHDGRGRPVIIGGFPHVEFDALVARRAGKHRVQLYPTEIGCSMSTAIDRMELDWKALGHDAPIAPAVTTYGRKEIAKWGGQQLPPGEVSVSDLHLACTVYDQEELSFYSREAAAIEVLLSFRSLVGRHAVREPGLQLGDADDTQPALPLGWADRAEAESEEMFDACTVAERAALLAHFTRRLPA